MRCKKILNFPKLSSYSIEQIFIDIGLYDKILIDCLELVVDSSYDEETQPDVLIVSKKLSALMNFLGLIIIRLSYLLNMFLIKII